MNRAILLNKIRFGIWKALRIPDTAALSMKLNLAAAGARYTDVVKEVYYYLGDRIDDSIESILRINLVAGLLEHLFNDRSFLCVVGCKVSSQKFVDI
ncbi:hypothetical protein HHK36_018525 [Tetracentron sinense]|uniref:Uncharacterized protein n=1 Tax=Tetracentron sinense TaxID=13715 RepID=A0A834YYN6_TETSI|nr:hypothetical protein HHK36_018525 [Tetracentron sinense]